jgi:hypothetical protein
MLWASDKMGWSQVKHGGLTSSGGNLADHLVPFEPAELVPETTLILNALQTVQQHFRAFVVILGHIGGIATRGDVQKVLVRMWIFGVISLIEMQLLRIIRDHYLGDS